MADRVTQLAVLTAVTNPAFARTTQFTVLTASSVPSPPRVTQYLLLVATAQPTAVVPPFEWEPCIPFEQGPVVPGSGDGL